MDPDRARELLRRERERIERAMADLGERDREMQAEPGDRDSEDLYQEDLYQSEFDATRTEDLAEQLAAVERAEGRVAAGTYGISIESGKPIPDDRLEAFPTAERTVDEIDRA